MYVVLTSPTGIYDALSIRLTMLITSTGALETDPCQSLLCDLKEAEVFFHSRYNKYLTSCNHFEETFEFRGGDMKQIQFPHETELGMCRTEKEKMKIESKQQLKI